MDGFAIDEGLFGNLTGSLIGKEVCVNGYFADFLKGFIGEAFSQKKLGVGQVQDIMKEFIVKIDLGELTEDGTKNELLFNVFDITRKNIDISDEALRVEMSQTTCEFLRSIKQYRKETIKGVYELCEYLSEKNDYMKELGDNRNEKNKDAIDSQLAETSNNMTIRTEETYTAVVCLYNRINWVGAKLIQISKTYDGSGFMMIEEEEEEEASDYIDDDEYYITSREWMTQADQVEEATIRQCFNCYELNYDDPELSKKFYTIYWIFMKQTNKFIDLKVSDNRLTSMFGNSLNFSNFKEYQLELANTSFLYCLLYINVIGRKNIPKDIIGLFPKK